MTADVQVALIGLVGTLSVALLGVLVESMRRHQKAISEVREHTVASLEQVQNSHTTNLRDDLDGMHQDVREVLSVLQRHGSEISGLRADLRQERFERMAVAERLAATSAPWARSNRPPR